ncbi:MAG: hypothetical protein R3250_00285 [Melioribacteraceae bacterium]|nr:hypothetical protein [Melioribacteraceae bacterium]
MAGYLFSIGKKNNKPDHDTLLDLIYRGIYSTMISEPDNYWMPPQEGTVADYSSMKEGDNVYFFIDRKIYGIGKLVNINGYCIHLNYPNSNHPTIQNYKGNKELLLYDNGEKSMRNRFICSFEPSPNFFQNGIDMDEVLFSDPERFKILRAFWKLSFIKFSDSENQAFKDIILRRNIEAIERPQASNVFNTNYKVYHDRIKSKTAGNDDYRLTIGPFLKTISTNKGSLRHEMAIEAALIYQLQYDRSNAREIFGEWDYITHQVIASPFKPIEYMDKMDVFGYKFIREQRPTISNYLVVEIKKDKVDSQDVLQLMKYVDWIKNEYAHGDYSMIKAFMLGFSYKVEAFNEFSEIIERKFIKGVRPSISTEWSDVKLIQYQYNEENELLDFIDVTPNQ